MSFDLKEYRILIHFAGLKSVLGSVVGPLEYWNKFMNNKSSKNYEKV